MNNTSMSVLLQLFREDVDSSCRFGRSDLVAEFIQHFTLLICVAIAFEKFQVLFVLIVENKSLNCWRV